MNDECFNKLDLRGKACPEPVIETRKALQAGTGELLVVVDDEATCENVGRMARSMGCEVRVESAADGAIHVFIMGGPEGEIRVRGLEQGGDSESTSECRFASTNVVLISSDCLGSGNDDLGWMLMRVFVQTLKEVVPRPSAILLLNSGVKLAVVGSELIRDLAELERRGTAVLACGTCLEFFELSDQLRVGQVTNMLEIVSRLSTADRVIRP